MTSGLKLPTLGKLTMPKPYKMKKLSIHAMLRTKLKNFVSQGKLKGIGKGV